MASSNYWDESLIDRSPKRTKHWPSESEDEIPDDFSTIPTLPVNHTTLRTPLTPTKHSNFLSDNIQTSSPPLTIPTQLVDTLPVHRMQNPHVQVAASSPIVIKESPRKPSRSPLPSYLPSSPTAFKSSGASSPMHATHISTDPQAFTASDSQFRMNGIPSLPSPQKSIEIDLTNDSMLPYAGSSSEDEGKKEVEKIPPSTFYSKGGQKTTSSFAARKREEARFGGTMSNIPMAPASSFRKNISHLSFSGSTLAPPPSSTLSRDYASRPLPQVARKRLVQRGPEPARPVIESTPPLGMKGDTSSALVKLRSIFGDTHSLDTMLNALVLHKGNYDDAANYLLTLSTEDDDVKEIINPTFTSPEKTTKRNVQKNPQKSVLEKYSTTQAQALAARKRRKSPVPAAPSPVKEVKPKRRLVKAGDRKKAADTDSEEAEKEEVVSIHSDSDSAASDLEVFDSVLDGKVLDYINRCTVEELIDVSYTTEAIAESIIAIRPFKSLDEVREVALAPVKKGAKGGSRKAVGDKVVDTCLETWRGYQAVDSLIETCDKMGNIVTEGIKAWGVDIFGAKENGELDLVELESVNTQRDSAIGTPSLEGSEKDPSETDSDTKMARRGRHTENSTLLSQPKLMAGDVTLKDYQVVGVNWLSLLYKKNFSCILADEMGLGKTCQVIAFMAHLKETGAPGPHLVVVPSSTLENWLREFARFCPALKVEPYYGSQTERVNIRQALIDNPKFDVIVTTYNMAVGSTQAAKMDMQFLRSQKFNVCVYDEGHMLKNSSSSRYANLMKLKANFRLLLTGTPLQNNLQELVSLLAFILPKVFKEQQEDLQSIFKFKAKTTDDADSNSALLSKERIKRARSMMTPFVLRRRKEQVLKNLPPKTKSVLYCNMTTAQKELYKLNEDRAKKALEDRENGIRVDKETNNTNLLMQLRKAAIHPLLFRRIYDDDTIRKMAKDVMREPQYCDGLHNEDYIREDMEVMNDFELNRLCGTFNRTLGKYKLQNEEWMDAGKVDELKRLLLEMRANGDRVLLFSQFTLVLDVLELVVNTLDLPFLRLDGSTNVQLRQDLIDQYHNEKDITVFLLSTKAGGFGINLACANKVIIFDSSFNPMDDLQAEDRAHRVGQTQTVEVVRLITRNTVEENILNLANTKLALDASLSGQVDEKAAEAVVKKAEDMVINMFKQQVVVKEQQQEGKTPPLVDDANAVEMKDANDKNNPGNDNSNNNNNDKNKKTKKEKEKNIKDDKVPSVIVVDGGTVFKHDDEDMTMKTMGFMTPTTAELMINNDALTPASSVGSRKRGVSDEDEGTTDSTSFNDDGAAGASVKNKRRKKRDGKK